jgi:two-component sensor histidine kinase
MEVMAESRLGQPIDVAQLLATTAAPWLIWVLATPLIVRAVRRRPLLRPLGVGAVAWHLALWTGITAAYVLAREALSRATGIPPAAVGLLEQFVAWLPFQLLAYAAVAGIAHAALYAGRAREQALERAILAEQLARAQLDALRVQLHPHFLFNALNTIAMLVREHDADTAVRLIAELGALLRELLRDATASEVPLRHELALLDRYLAIEQVRFGERLRVEHSIDRDVLDAAVPPLVLQPLVENALRHGIVSGTGLLRIEAAGRDDTLVLSVHDNGADAGPRASSPAEAGGCGVGLANTRERLLRMYGERAYVRLARTADGTLATVVLPRRSIAASGDAASPAAAVAVLAPAMATRRAAAEASRG